MGGECDGDIASRIVIQTIVSILSRYLIPNASDAYIRDVSAQSVLACDSKISEYVEQHPESCGMGSTVLLAIRRGDMLFITWCGDSHCYAYKDGKLSSLTKDHSYVQQLIDAKRISIEDSFKHPDNNLITRYVGGGADTCIPDFCMHQLTDSELIIICSDGLSGYCMNGDIAQDLDRVKAVKDIPRRLTDLARHHGSDDDISVVALAPESFHSSSRPGWLKRLFGA